MYYIQEKFETIAKIAVNIMVNNLNPFKAAFSLSRFRFGSKARGTRTKSAELLKHPAINN